MARLSAHKIAMGVVVLLLWLQAAVYAELAYALLLIFHGASNVSPSDPWPEFVWRPAVIASLYFACGVAYLMALRWIRLLLIVPACFSLIYGIRGYLAIFRNVLSWVGVVHGDLVALGATNTVIFMALGIAGIADWLFYLVALRRKAGANF